MSKSGCLALILGLGALAVLTGLCSYTSFSLSQQTVIDMHASGARVDDPLDTLRCAIAGKCEDETIRESQASAPVLVLTALVTAVPTATAPEADTPVPTAAAIASRNRIARASCCDGDGDDAGRAGVAAHHRSARDQHPAAGH